VGSALNQSLPVNSTDRTRVLVRLDGATRNDDVSPNLALLAVERAVPIRRFFAWRGKRNYEGLWWSSTVRAHVPFESLLEREYLMWADFDADIVAIAAQPLALLWPRGTPGHKNHVPDFFVRLHNGDGRLVDDRHPDCVDDPAALEAQDAQSVEHFEQSLAQAEEVIDLRRLFGSRDYFVRVAVADLAAYETFLSSAS
jgi:hypothetical protein